MMMRDRGYTSLSLHTSVLNLEDNGWSDKGLSIKCLVPPAVVELGKGGCKGEWELFLSK